MLKSNYHTHTFLCMHAEGKPIDYVKRAIEVGMEEIGISDHGPMLNDLPHRMSIDDFYNTYLPDIDKAIDCFGDKIKIYKGVELEYFPEFDSFYEKLLEDLDYMILGQHDIRIEGGTHDVYQHMNPEFIKQYEYQVIKGLKSGYFRVLAHPEIFMYNYHTWNIHAKNCLKNIIEASIETNVLLELNVNGARRKKVTTADGRISWVYPRLEFWELVASYPKSRVIINEDAHFIENMNDEATKEVIDFAKRLNLNIVDQLF